MLTPNPVLSAPLRVGTRPSSDWLRADVSEISPEGPLVIRCMLLKLRVYCLPFAYEASTHWPTLHLADHVTRGKSFASTTVLCALPFISWELPELSSWEAEGEGVAAHSLTYTHSHTYIHTSTVRGEKRKGRGGEETERTVERKTVF